MSQLTQITLSDGSQELTFKPAGIDQNGVASLVSGDGIILADKRYTLSARTSQQRRKAKLKLELPVVQTETVNGIGRPVQVHKAYVSVDFDFSVASTTAERQEARNLIIAALQDGLATSIIDDNETIY